MRIYTQRIRQTLAESIAKTYYGNVISSKVKEDVIVCRTYSEETLENISEEVFSKTTFDKLLNLFNESDIDFVPVTEWFNKDKPELQQFMPKEKFDDTLAD
jgi:hypothetical protein